MSDFPLQPIVTIDKVTRFVSNAIVRRLMEHGRSTGLSLNELAEITFAREDWVQFAQLIGYSLSGFGELSYVTRLDIDRAEAAATAGTDAKDKLIKTLEIQLKDLRDALRPVVAELYNIHPDDLRNNDGGDA